MYAYVWLSCWYSHFSMEISQSVRCLVFSPELIFPVRKIPVVRCVAIRLFEMAYGFPHRYGRVFAVLVSVYKIGLLYRVVPVLSRVQYFAFEILPFAPSRIFLFEAGDCLSR